MNSERTHAYGKVVKLLDDLGPAKLQPAELDRIRLAADTLVFASTAEEARLAIGDVQVLVEHLVAVDRWTEERADELMRDLEGCGPEPSPVG
jgi:hypothetical protein